jgi:hypothetical protein
MKFKLEITLDNAAFDPDPGLEVAGLLSKVAHKAEYAGEDLKDSLWRCAIVDTNGNRVGYAEVEGDETTTNKQTTTGPKRSDRTNRKAQ